MNQRILDFRNSCAEDGVELTVGEAKKYYKAYLSLRESIQEAIEEVPYFYRDLCNKTLEEKLLDMKQIKERDGCEITLREYNELQHLIKKICELEG